VDPERNLHEEPIAALADQPGDALFVVPLGGG
jgi:hypothetical protein